MSVLAHHVAFVVAAVALVGAAWRYAATLHTAGTVRVLATAATATAVAVAETLLLSPLGLGDEWAALLAAAVLTYAAARALLPPSSPTAQLRAAWLGATRSQRVRAGALAALFLGGCAWQLRHPRMMVDSLIYHLALPASWLHEGTPASSRDLVEGLQVGNFPLTNEVLSGWALTLSRSWVFASIWTPVLAVLIGIATWTGLRALRVPGSVAGLAVLAFLSLPLMAGSFAEPSTDAAATAWLGVCAALCAASLAGRTPLLAPAILSAALAFGTKPTPAFLLAVVLGATTYAHRARLRPYRGQLGAATGLGFFVGAIWPLRNLIDHGSPFWPFSSGPFGDPVPPVIAPYTVSFLENPSVLEGRLDVYLSVLAGAALILAVALLAPLARRTRTVLTAMATTVGGLLVWAAAPGTAVAKSDALAAGTTRFLLPVLLAALVTVALVAHDRASGPAVRAAQAVLGAAAVWSIGRLMAFGFPTVPSAALLITFLASGAGAALLLGRRWPDRIPPPALGGVCAAGVAVALALASDGYVGRHAQLGLYDAGLLRELGAQPGWDDAETEVAMGPATVALAGGDRLTHPVALLRSDEPCSRIKRRAGLIVLQRRPPTAAYRTLARCLGPTGIAWRDTVFELYAPRTR